MYRGGNDHIDEAVNAILRELPRRARARFMAHIPKPVQTLIPGPVVFRYASLLRMAYLPPKGVDPGVQKRRLRNYERKLHRNYQEKQGLDQLFEVISRTTFSLQKTAR